MKIEQIETNKLQIILSKEDLEKNEISFHSIMSNSIGAQKLFLAVLDIAEKEIGFNTTNYDIAIETLSLNNSNLIFTITRFKKPVLNKYKRLSVSRKHYNINSTYKFNNFNDFYDFFKLIKISPNYIKSLFYFNNNFYYIQNLDNLKHINKNLILEFASPCMLNSSIIKNLGIQIY